MSGFNILALTGSFMLYFPSLTVKLNYSLTSNATCILATFFTRFFIQMSTWTNVMVSADRVIVVLYPTRFRFIDDKKKLTWIALVLFAILAILNVPNLFYKLVTITKYDYVTNRTIEDKLCTSSDSLVFIRNLEITLFRIIIPIILQIIFSIILIYKLIKSARDVNRSLKQEYRFAFIIVILNVLFIITEFPLMVTTLYLGVIGETPTYPMDTNISRNLAVVTLAFYITLTISTYMFLSLFFVNISFNKLYQKEIRNIICGPIQTQRNSRR